MGACVSTPECCVGGRLSSLKRRKCSCRRKKPIKRRAPSRSSDRSLDRVDNSAPPDRSYHNPTFHVGSIEEAWFDSAAILESDCDEDFRSVQDDVPSLNGLEGTSISSIASPSEANNRDCSVDTSSTDQLERPRDSSTENFAHNSVGEVAKNSFHSDDVDSRSKSVGTPSEERQPVFKDELSSVDESAGKEEELLDNCGIIANNCLPCLASTVSSVDKHRSLSSSPPSARKKIPLKLSFKWREGHPNAAILVKCLLQIFHELIKLATCKRTHRGINWL